MPRRARNASAGGAVYHVLNRGCGRMRLFGRPADYDAFLKLLAEARRLYPSVQILAYCLMPNHWHLVLLPTEDGELSKFVGWVTMTHALRWRYARKVVGLGPLYQGRFKSFPVETDEHLLTVLRYVERNALRAKLVRRVEEWLYGSAHARTSDPARAADLLSDWPIDRPSDWSKWLNEPQTAAEEAEVRRSVQTGRPFGNRAWQSRVAKQMNFDLDPRPRGRPAGSKNKPRK